MREHRCKVAFQGYRALVYGLPYLSRPHLLDFYLTRCASFFESSPLRGSWDFGVSVGFAATGCKSHRHTKIPRAAQAATKTCTRGYLTWLTPLLSFLLNKATIVYDAFQLCFVAPMCPFCNYSGHLVACGGSVILSATKDLKEQQHLATTKIGEPGSVILSATKDL